MEEVDMVMNTTLVKLGSINLKPKPIFKIHPYKDLRCSRNCYLNWANYGQKLPLSHSCKCDKFKYL